MRRILVVNGPNLNLLGRREPEVYGHETLADLEARLHGAARRWPDVELVFFQSNGEGEIIDFLQAEAPAAAGVILNAAGLTHTSVALRDAVRAAGVPTIEVHLSNIWAREPFRRRSLLAGVCTGSICGLGVFGYEAALEALVRRDGDSTRRG
jgi:3-dehydroquinate dehydratase-2